MLEMNITELVLTLASILIMAAYHYALYRQVQADPMSTAIGVTNHARRVWVQSIMVSKRDILAIQTMRNWVMASTFLASTAALISLALVSTAFRCDPSARVTQSLTLFSHSSPGLWMLKMLVLSILFFFAFFNFTLAVRYYNHAGLLINVPPEHEPSATVDIVASILNHGALHYTLGMRGFYLSLPMALLLFGAPWMLAGSLLTVAILNHLDHEA